MFGRNAGIKNRHPWLDGGNRLDPSFQLLLISAYCPQRLRLVLPLVGPSMAGAGKVPPYRILADSAVFGDLFDGSAVNQLVTSIQSDFLAPPAAERLSSRLVGSRHNSLSAVPHLYGHVLASS
jgi:hypothetical protein